VVGAASDKFAFAILEFLYLFAKLDEFGRADKREILGVEEIADPFVLVGIVADLLEAVLAEPDACVNSELWKTIANGQHEKPFRISTVECSNISYRYL
jgi:hypothetical protein